MKTIDELYGSNKTLEQEGALFDLGIQRLRLAHIGGTNTKIKAALEEMARPYRQAIDMDVLKDEIAWKLGAEFLVDNVIKSWEVPGEDGAWVPGIPNVDENLQPLVIPYTRENAVAVLMKYPALQQQLQRLATARAAYAPSRANYKVDAGN